MKVASAIERLSWVLLGAWLAILAETVLPLAVAQPINPVSGSNSPATNIAFVQFVARGVNFNAGSSDTPVAVQLPPGYTRYLVLGVRLGNGSASLSSATLGVFGAAGGGAPTIVADSAITLTSPTPGQANSAANFSTALTVDYINATLFVRVGTPQGSAATGDVVILLQPLS